MVSVDLGSVPKGHRHAQYRTDPVGQEWTNKYRVVFFNHQANFTGMELLYFEPVLGLEGKPVKDWNSQLMVEFQNGEADTGVENPVYIVPKRLLKGIE